MADSDRAARGGKRERLVASAYELLHHNGVARTTLADIAQAADVPLGNVYYYFKTKDDLVRAVIDSHAEDIREALRSIEKSHRSPRTRLLAFARSVSQVGQTVARYGCPHGSLCVELDKHDDGLEKAVAVLMTLHVDWAREQFRELGRKDADDLAISLVSTVQGAALLANAFRDPGVLTSQTRQLERWINGLA